MTGFQLTFETDSAHLVGLVADLHAKLTPTGLVGFMQGMVDPWLRMRTDNRFESGGDDVTGPWHPLTMATQMIRASQGFPPSHPINVRTGKMKSFLVGQRSDVKPTGIGATLTYPGTTGDAELQQKISTAQQGRQSPRTPPRPVVGVNENDMLFITSELAAWLTEGYL